MATNACNLKSIKPGKNCSEQFAGTGTQMYFVPASQFDESGKHHPVYKDDKAEFDDDCFAAANCETVYVFPIVSGTGQVTGSSNGQAKGFSNVANGRVAKGVDIMAWNGRVMNNTEFYYILLDSGKTVVEGEGAEAVVKHVYYVVGSSTYAPTLALDYDSGTTPDSDSGITVQVTASPMLYLRPTWTGILAAPTD